MGHIYLETESFIIRQWEPEDAGELFKIMSDEKVHTYTGDTPWTMERTIGYINYLLDKDFKTLEQFHGACILKSGNKLIGFTGLNYYLPKSPEIEWQIGVPYWGKGYASEIGRGVIDKAFETTDIVQIYGMANPENAASIKVMGKIGMTCLGLQDFRGEQDLFYKVER